MKTDTWQLLARLITFAGWLVCVIYSFTEHQSGYEVGLTLIALGLMFRIDHA